MGFNRWSAVLRNAISSSSRKNWSMGAAADYPCSHGCRKSFCESTGSSSSPSPSAASYHLNGGPSYMRGVVFWESANTPYHCVFPIMSFALDKESGKKCYMLGAQMLTIPRGSYPVSLPESRFPEVVQILAMCSLEIRGQFETRLLTQKTNVHSIPCIQN